MDSFWTRKFRWIAAKAAFLIVCIASILSCAAIKEVPVQQKDSTIIKEVVVDTVVKVKLEKEYIEKIVPIEDNDTLSFLENSVSTSLAGIEDGKLFHNLKTKDSTKISTIYKVKTEYKYVYVDVPIEVPKPYIPKWCWILLAVDAAIIGFFVAKIILKFKLKR